LRFNPIDLIHSEKKIPSPNPKRPIPSTKNFHYKYIKGTIKPSKSTLNVDEDSLKQLRNETCQQYAERMTGPPISPEEASSYVILPPARIEFNVARNRLIKNCSVIPEIWVWRYLNKLRDRAETYRVCKENGIECNPPKLIDPWFMQRVQIIGKNYGR
jgi:hypothetical protein